VTPTSLLSSENVHLLPHDLDEGLVAEARVQMHPKEAFSCGDVRDLCLPVTSPCSALAARGYLPALLSSRPSGASFVILL
jgi:hypothetical protein